MQKNFMFKNVFFIVCGILFVSACKNDKMPTTPVQILIRRFDKVLFESDIKNTKTIDSIQDAYPFFYPDFTDNILGIPSIPNNQEEVKSEINKFVNSYQRLYPQIEAKFKDLTSIEAEFEQGFENLRTHLPQYKIPRIVSFIGPVDGIYQSWYGATPDFINDSVIGISLLLHAGENLMHLKQPLLEDMYDQYLLRKFTPETIVPNCFKNIVEDIYSDKSSAQNLINQIVEKGKKIYFVKQLLPQISDTILFGYSQSQLTACIQSESMIWKSILTNNNLYSKDPQVIRNFIGDAPFTTGLSKDIPGYLGLWMGYQIVEQYMAKNKDKKMTKLMKMDNEKIFKASSYKARKA